MSDICDKVIEYIKHDNINDSFILLRNIDFYSLKYEDDDDLILLFLYLTYKIRLHHFSGIYSLLSLAKKHSEITYYHLTKNISIIDIDYTNEIILSIESKITLEKVIQNSIHSSRDITLKTENEGKNQFEDYQLEFDCIVKDSKYKSLYIQLRERINQSYSLCISEPNPKDLPAILLVIHKNINALEINKIPKYLELLKSSEINQNLIEYYNIMHALVTDRQLFIPVENVIRCIENIYLDDDIDDDIDVDDDVDYVDKIKLFFKYIKIEKLVFLLLKLSSNKYCEIYKSEIEKYYLVNMNRHDFCENSQNRLSNIIIQYHGFLRTYDKENSKYHTLECIKAYKGKKLIVVNSILDLIVLYYSIGDHVTICSLYNQYKKILIEKTTRSKLSMILFNVVIPSLIYTHEIESTRELNDNLSVIPHYNPVMVSNYEKIKMMLDNLEKSKNFILSAGFNVIDEYDYKEDPKGLKNEENKIVCPICYESIEKEKITVIECVKCNKYIGHLTCVSKYLKSKKPISCIICRHKY